MKTTAKRNETKNKDFFFDQDDAMIDRRRKMKYRLTKDTRKLNGHTLYRIVCVTAFASVSVGDIGGWIESEDNLSQDGNAWVYDDATVFDNATVFGNARVRGNAMVYGKAWVYGKACVFGNATVYGNVEVFGNAWLCDNATVFGNARVCDNAMVYGDARVCDNARVCGNVEVCGNATVCDSEDYIVLKNSWSSGRYLTYTASNKMWKVGCFYGTGQELIAKAYKDSELSGKCYEASVKYVESIEMIKKRYK